MDRRSSRGDKWPDETVWLQELLRALDVGVHAIDPAGITLFYNERAARLDGLRPEDVVGRHVLDVFPSLTEETSSLLCVLRTQEVVSHRRQTYRNFRGAEVHTSNTTRAVFADGRLLGALEVSMDITEVQHLAEQVVDLQAARLGGAGRGRPAATVRWTLDDLITQSARVMDVKRLAQRVAQTSSPVLVCGPTGVGKELLVQGIHHASKRTGGPFIAQNCAALPAALLEGILFGTVRGSFTGAENRPGLFELASGGTLFLDEINSMPLDLQAKLLRALEEQQIRRLGDTKMIPVDVRIVAAMNEEPEDALRRGALRPDLYYRIQVVMMRLPSLRERPEDILPLARHFVADFAARFGKPVRGFTPAAELFLASADWPGNVRELRHAIEAGMNIVDGDWLDVADLAGSGVLRDGLHGDRASQGAWTPQQQSGQRSDAGRSDGRPADHWAGHNAGSLADRVRRFESACIAQALDEESGNVSRAAQRLQIPRQTLQSKMHKLGLPRT